LQRVLGFYSDAVGQPFREFSNFYEHQVPFDFVLPSWAVLRCKGIPERVPCEFSEKAIMLTKAALMGDAEIFNSIMQAKKASECKKLGRGVRSFDQELWDTYLEETAFEVVRQKFEADDSVRKVLLSTGDKVLVEAAPKDCIWGVGLKLGDPRLQDEQTWQGRNVLGKALMRARAHIRGEGSATAVVELATPARSAAAEPVVAEQAAAAVVELGAATAKLSVEASASSPVSRQRVLGFYGHGAGNPYREFSNFYQSGESFSFELPSFAQAAEFPSAIDCEFSEKAIMLTKAALMQDLTTFGQIAGSTSPAECKALGRQVQNFDDALWTKHLPDIAFEVLRQKFEASDSLQKLLLSTGDVIIAEATRNDRIWGIGIDVGDTRVQDPSKWLGRNVLGQGLMDVRGYFRSQLKAGNDDEDAQPLKKMRWNRPKP